MNLYLDTEFNGFGGELISMAIVAESGERFYEVLPLPIIIYPWVYVNVIPHLDKSSVSTPKFKFLLWDFLGKFKSPIIFCDWHEDAVHFFKMLSGPDYATSISYECSLQLLTGDTYSNSKVPHNALSDAIALMEWHRQRKAA